MSPARILGGRRQALCISVASFSLRPSVAWRDISVLSGGISIKLGTYIHHMQVGIAEKVFKIRSQRWRLHVYKCVTAVTAKTYIVTACHRGLLVSTKSLITILLIIIMWKLFYTTCLKMTQRCSVDLRPCKTQIFIMWAGTAEKIFKVRSQRSVVNCQSSVVNRHTPYL